MHTKSKILLPIVAIVLMACSTPDPVREIQTVTEERPRVSLTLPPVDSVKQRPVEWILVPLPMLMKSLFK